jgi:hypothetical protein
VFVVEGRTQIMSQAARAINDTREVRIPSGDVTLSGELNIPRNASGVVLFARDIMKAGTAISRKQAAISFMQLVASGKVSEAYQNYIGPNFRHHNPFFRRCRFVEGRHGRKRGQES